MQTKSKYRPASASGVLACLLLAVCPGLAAQYGYQSNPYTPYPPSCTTLPDLDAEPLEPGVVLVAEQRVALSSGRDPDASLPADMFVYRAACAEPGRSVI